MLPFLACYQRWMLWMRHTLYHFFSSAITFNSVTWDRRQGLFVENRLPLASIYRTGNNVLLRSSRENILLDGMGADLSRPVVPSESRLRSYDVSDVIVIIGIIMCHVAWSPSHVKSPEWAVQFVPSSWCIYLWMFSQACDGIKFRNILYLIVVSYQSLWKGDEEQTGPDVNEKWVCGPVVQSVFRRLQLASSFLWPLTVKLFCYDNMERTEPSMVFPWLWTKLTWDLTLPV